LPRLATRLFAPDLLVPPGMLAAVPHVSEHIIPGAGHLPCFEQPAEFNALLAARLALLDTGAPHPCWP
jgi:pimeloyl-ACP methyl ester carboxylesterase